MRLFSWFRGSGGLSNPDKGFHVSGPDSHSTDSGIILSDERAMALSAVWSCARLITETVSSLPLAVYERTATGRAAITDHYLYNLLRIAPNADMDPLQFREAMTLQLVLWGNAYAKIDRNGQGTPIAITPLRADRMNPVRGDNSIVYKYQTTEGEKVFQKDDILHVLGMSVDGIIGLSPLAYARHTMGISVSADKFASKAFSKNGRPTGFISVEQNLSADQREAYRKMYEAATADDSKTWVFEGGAKYNAVSIPPDDLQMLQSREFQLAEIARIFRVPSYLINDTAKSTSWGTGIEQQNLGFLTYTIRPYLTRWESAVANKLLSRVDREKYFIEHNVEGLLRADSAARANFYSTAAQNGWMTRNEIRRKENLPPIEGGDELTVQVNLTPASELPKVANNGV